MSSNTISPLQRGVLPAWLFVAATSAALSIPEGNAPAVNITEGLVLLNSPSALALTLAAPIAGAPDNGGNDGQILQIMCIQTAPLPAQVVHTITCPANTVNGVGSVLSINGTVGESCSLVAYGGVWWIFAGSGAFD